MPYIRKRTALDEAGRSVASKKKLPGHTFDCSRVTYVQGADDIKNKNTKPAQFYSVVGSKRQPTYVKNMSLLTFGRAKYVGKHFSFFKLDIDLRFTRTTRIVLNECVSCKL